MVEPGERNGVAPDEWAEEPTTAQNLNSSIRFMLELAVLAAVIHGSLTIVGGDLGWFLAVGGALLASFIWVNFVNPRGVMTPSDPWRLFIEITVFAVASALLFAAERYILAVAFTAFAIGHLIATFALDQRQVAPKQRDGPET